MSSNILLKGKHSGSKFEDILEHDFPYCQFIVSLKHISKDFQEFRDFLDANLVVKIDKIKQEELARLSKRFS